jgi:lipopolysaccharide/colanic/teichoic acid biosynthesis glycosyltransferase
MTDSAPEPDVSALAGPSRVHGLGQLVKRAIDIAVAVGLLIVISPILAAIAIAVRLDSKGPAIYRARRIGLEGRLITVYKFRSMVTGADHGVHLDYVRKLLRDDGSNDPESLFKLDKDDRVTRVGRFLRRTSLDELPQLANVALGSMSLVGPRPEVPAIIEVYEPWMFRRFACRPGMTGLWQISGRGAIPPREMLRLDVEYVDTWSLRRDFKIMLLTPFRALSTRGTR